MYIVLSLLLVALWTVSGNDFAAVGGAAAENLMHDNVHAVAANEGNELKNNPALIRQHRRLQEDSKHKRRARSFLA